MLLTFSRRAAAEMQRRVERITSEVLGTKRASARRPRMNWSGTFHAMRRQAAPGICARNRTQQEFTIHDREDSADPDESRSARPRAIEQRPPLPNEGHLPVDLFAHRQRPSQPRGDPRPPLLLVRRMGSGTAPTVRGLRRGKAGPERARLRRPASLLGAYDGGGGSVAEQVAARFDHVLVDEYQDTNRLQASILWARSRRAAG